MVEKKDSATALSKQSPFRPILDSILFSARAFLKCSLVYCDPRSEWNMSGFIGLRPTYASFSASLTRRVVIDDLSAHLMIFREKRAIPKGCVSHAFCLPASRDGCLIPAWTASDDDNVLVRRSGVRSQRHGLCPKCWANEA